VLDFGVAKFLRESEGGAELTQHDAAVGTPRYMAPEQISAGQEVDFRTDIYAVGGILYFMLTGGRAPLEGDSVERVWQAKLNEDPTPLSTHRPDIPGRLEALVMSCLARAPQDRPASMTDLKAALVGGLESVRAMESGLLPMKAPSETAVVTRINWRQVGLVAGGATLLALAAVVVFWQRTAPEAIPVAVAINTLRVTSAAFVATSAGTDAVDRFHDLSGLVLFAVAFAVLMGWKEVLRWIEERSLSRPALF